MDLNTVWFILICVLFTGFFFLEGFDYGVGILLPFLGKNDRERREIINTIGPFWDGNEVWLITAGGAMFAAFPNWYATMFSGYYLALTLMLLALILRAVAFEFRSKDKRPEWRSLWDWIIFGGSLIPALLWGVAVSNLLLGLPINGDMHFVGNFFSLLSPLALLSGLITLAGFTLHGAIFLTLRTTGEIESKARAVAGKLWIPVAVLVALAGITIGLPRGILLLVLPLIAAALIVVAGLLIRQRSGWPFILSGLSIALLTISLFAALYPNVMVSSLNPAWNLTIHNASSSPYTLTIMSIVALIFVPFVLLYQGWSYWIFRKRIGPKTQLEY